MCGGRRVCVCGWCGGGTGAWGWLAAGSGVVVAAVGGVGGWVCGGVGCGLLGGVDEWLGEAAGAAGTGGARKAARGCRGAAASARTVRSRVPGAAAPSRTGGSSCSLETARRCPTQSFRAAPRHTSANRHWCCDPAHDAQPAAHSWRSNNSNSSNNSQMAPAHTQDQQPTGGAGGVDCVVGPHEACVHGQHGAAHVVDGKGDAEGVHLAVACAKAGGRVR